MQDADTPFANAFSTTAGDPRLCVVHGMTRVMQSSGTGVGGTAQLTWWFCPVCATTPPNPSTHYVRFSPPCPDCAALSTLRAATREWKEAFTEYRTGKRSADVIRRYQRAVEQLLAATEPA